MEKKIYRKLSKIKVYHSNHPLRVSLVCLGDGHDGVWHLIQPMAPQGQRREMLDWYHLMENLHKVGDLNSTYKSDMLPQLSDRLDRSWRDL